MTDYHCTNNEFEDYDIDFRYDDNMHQYKDSMLFDVNEQIACAALKKGIHTVNVSLEVCGEVAVTYKGEVYHMPSSFPQELRDLIRNEPHWNCNEDVYVAMNNWFEYVYDIDGTYSNGIICELDLAAGNPEETVRHILNDMVEIADDLLEKIEQSQANQIEL